MDGATLSLLAPQGAPAAAAQELGAEVPLNGTDLTLDDDANIADGAVVDSVEPGVAKVMNGSLGPTMVLIERQAYDPAIDSVARELRPKVMLMQTNAISLLELEAIKELAVKRSYNQAHLIICASDVGPCADELCLGTSLAVFQGEILVEADVSAAGIVDFSVDMSKFLDYDVLRDAVEIPELLRRKYH